MLSPAPVAAWSDLPDRIPRYPLVGGVDLLVVRFDDDFSVMYGPCLHRGALMTDGHVVGDDLICGVHPWDYQVRTGVSSYNNAEPLQRFRAEVDGDSVLVDAAEVAAWEREHPQPYDRDGSLGLYLDPHGAVSATGVPPTELPRWDDIQLVTGQLAHRPLLDDAPVATDMVLAPNAAKPLRFDIPMFVSDMSYGALSEEAKIALSHGAELAGTGICSGEGGMVPEEQEGNSRYLYELASGRFGWSLDKVKRCEASHFLSRACGHSPLRQFDAADPVVWKRDMADLAGVRCVGVGA
jgi:nitrite reductase/ring-hydroxylating ferredoxin subunit